MNTFAIATRLRLRDALHDMRADRLRTLRVEQERDAERFLTRSHLLGLFIAGASGPAGETILPDVVGYGSEVEVVDVRTGLRARHRLMSGETMLLEAGHVSVESPMGGALLGRRVGDVVRVASPGGERELRIDRLQTLDALLDEWAGEAVADPAPWIRTGTDG
jgi:transcription elongation GreA/GreB family factor